MQKNIYGVIYLIKNKINNKIYIGQTIHSFSERYKNGNLLNTHNIHLKRAVLKFGHENFYVDEVFDIAYSKEDLDKLEDMYIKIYKSYNRKYGYNLRLGGSRGKHSEESKQKNRKAHLGRKLPKEFCKAISIRTKGERNPFYGKHHTEKSRMKISEAHKKENLSKETLDKMRRNNLKGNNPFAKKIYCITTNEVFSYINEAALKYNIDSSSISKVCKGKLNWRGKSNNGEKLIWCYYDEYLALKEDLINKKTKFLDKKKNKSKRKLDSEKINFKKIICLTTGEVFDCIMDASRKYNVDNSNIAKSCKKIYSYAGKDVNGNKLIWAYYNEYLKNIN